MFKFSHFYASGAYVAPVCKVLSMRGNQIIASSTGSEINAWIVDEDGLEC